jgi:predicted DNA-binding protein with PD1-like motif
MKVSEGRLGRVFIVRLDEGDIVPDCLEEFAAGQGITHGQVVLIGGIGGGEVVVGPRKSAEMPPDPMLLPLDGAHEVAGLGIIAPGPDGKPGLHIHAALGRAGKTTTGCLREGVSVWLVGEAVIYEILGSQSARLPDQASGFSLLETG